MPGGARSCLCPAAALSHTGSVKAFPFKKLDAFATATSTGNPAAAIYLNALGDLRDPEMLRVARELKGFVSEVGFVAQTGPASFEIRYFSSEKEVEFCGHATVAIMYDLISGNEELAGLGHVLLRTNKGLLPIENRLRSEDAVYVHAPAPVFIPMEIAPNEICGALGLAEGAIDRATEIGIVNGGLQTLCLPLARLDDVLDAAPDFGRLNDFCRAHGLDVVVIFTSDVADQTNRLRTRVFAAPFGYLEDPATGSANAALGYHLHRIGRWDGSPIRIEQNAQRLSPNLVRLASVPDSEHGIRVVFGGGAICRIEGRYWI